MVAILMLYLQQTKEPIPYNVLVRKFLSYFIHHTCIPQATVYTALLDIREDGCAKIVKGAPK